MQAHPWAARLVALVLVLCLTGCESTFTERVWANGALHHTVKPVFGQPVDVYYSPSRRDFLLAYQSEERFSIKPRQFYLAENVDQLEGRRRPVYVSERLAGLQPVPVNRGTNVLPAAFITNSVLIHTELGVIGPYPLPAYDDGGGTPLQVVLTPFAVAGDLALIGAIAAVVAAAYSAPYWANTH